MEIILRESARSAMSATKEGAGAGGCNVNVIFEMNLQLVHRALITENEKEGSLAEWHFHFSRRILSWPLFGRPNDGFMNNMLERKNLRRIAVLLLIVQEFGYTATAFVETGRWLK